MGGICGWIGTGKGPLPRDGAAMPGALSHRGRISRLDWSDGEAAPVAEDSAFNPHEAVSAAWSGWHQDPAAFASRLEGSFAVAASDKREGRLVLVRDRLGEKPLYYVATPAGVAFASEIKALRAAGALPDLSLSPEALDAYLAFTYIPAPWTIFTHVLKVPAGHCVVFDLRMLASGAFSSAIQTIRYWSLPQRVGERASPSQMLEMLRGALRRRLPASGRLAAYLSGGLDSSIVAALMADERRSRLDTFSIGFTDESLDESRHARRVASLVGAEHHVITLRDVDPELVIAVVEQLDEPMADAAAIPSFVLGREAAGAPSDAGAFVPTVMTGDGADALLAGDHWFRRLKRLEAIQRLPGALQASLSMAAGLAGPRRHRRYQELLTLLDLPPAERYLRMREKWTLAERLQIYSGEIRRRVDGVATQSTYLNAPVDWKAGESVDAAMRLDSIHGLPEDLLMKADKMGMAHGVESRSPFLDQQFVEWTARLEIGLLLNGSTSKYLLKKAAEELLPRDLVYRRKHGFQVPMGRWLKGSLRELMEVAFSQDLIGRQGIFDAAALRGLRRRFETGPSSPALDGKVWQIVAFQTWWRGVFEGG